VNLDGQCKFWKTPDTAEAAAEEEPACSGPPDTEPESVPACSLDGGAFPWAAAATTASSSAEPGIPWMPGSEEVDRTISFKENTLLKATSEGDCNEPTFWLDICSKIPTNVSEYVNLKLNPERYTGYNGTHVWEAIYQENCFKNQNVEQMCYEERVLYRMLSGMHTSTNIHISANYYPPKKGVRNSTQPNPARFVQQYNAHPDRLKNMYFTYVVLLRALRRASPYLYTFPFQMSPDGEDNGIDHGRTTYLVQRLLDSHILRSCGPVFEAFDETLMFDASDGAGQPQQAALKSQFKDVFHNISMVHMGPGFRV
jgi:hypothetical protein